MNAQPTHEADQTTPAVESLVHLSLRHCGQLRQIVLEISEGRHLSLTG